MSVQTLKNRGLDTHEEIVHSNTASRSEKRFLHPCSTQPVSTSWWKN